MRFTKLVLLIWALCFFISGPGHAPGSGASPFAHQSHPCRNRLFGQMVPHAELREALCARCAPSVRMRMRCLLLRRCPKAGFDSDF